MEASEAREKILALRAEVEEHSRRYYDEDAPTISDFEYDKLIHRLMDLEEGAKTIDRNNQIGGHKA